MGLLYTLKSTNLS